MDGFSTNQAGKPARMDLTGRVGADALLTLRGTVGPVGGPLRLDLNGEIRGFAVPRTNPYLLRQVAWEAREGWLTTTLRCRIDGDALDAKTEILLNRLQVARAGGNDQAQARIGLPLGMIVSLMKDRRGDIHIALPIGASQRSALRLPSHLERSATGRQGDHGAGELDRPVHVGADSRIQRIEIDPIPFGRARP
jgi:hypothetical protein